MNKFIQQLNPLPIIIFGIIVGNGILFAIVNNNVPTKQITTVVNNDSTLLNKIKELEDENEILRDEIQLREGEISYWGRKYDDLKNKRND